MAGGGTPSLQFAYGYLYARICGSVPVLAISGSWGRDVSTRLLIVLMGYGHCIEVSSDSTIHLQLGFEVNQIYWWYRDLGLYNRHGLSIRIPCYGSLRKKVGCHPMLTTRSVLSGIIKVPMRCIQ
ncbi:hypothetical protein RSAG8_11380, partial [Rhizoctonia solani AG-8 WAC10335]